MNCKEIENRFQNLMQRLKSGDTTAESALRDFGKELKAELAHLEKARFNFKNIWKFWK